MACIFLGPSETIGTFAPDLFEPLNKRWNIFRRKGGATALHALPEMPAQPRVEGVSETTAATGRSSPTATPNIVTVLERLLLNLFAPTSVVVNDRGDIIYIHGQTGVYLEPSPGQPRSNILEMARKDLT